MAIVFKMIAILPCVDLKHTPTTWHFWTLVTFSTSFWGKFICTKIEFSVRHYKLQWNLFWRTTRGAGNVCMGFCYPKQCKYYKKYQRTKIMNWRMYVRKSVILSKRDSTVFKFCILLHRTEHFIISHIFALIFNSSHLLVSV